MVEDPVQHGGCKCWIPHHLCPVNDLLIGGKDDGAGFICVADKGKKAVRLSTADWCVTDLINNDKLCLSDPGLQFLRIEFFQRADIWRKMRCGVVLLPAPLILALYFRFYDCQEKLPAG